MNDKHSDLSELIELYVLGGLTPSEAAELEEHLKQCPLCSEQVAELRESTGLQPLASDPVLPPADTNDRISESVLDSTEKQEMVPVFGAGILASIEPSVLASTDKLIDSGYSEKEEQNPYGFLQPTRGSRKTSQRSKSRMGWRILFAGLIAALICLVGVITYQLNDKVTDLQHQVDQNVVIEMQLQTAKQENFDLKSKLSASLKPVQGLKLDEAIKLAPVSQDITAKGLAAIVMDSQGTHLVVQAEKLPQLQNNEAFQVWLIKDDEHYNAGTFLSKDGVGALYYTFDPGDYETVAITLEPDAYGNLPRGKAILSAPIQG